MSHASFVHLRARSAYSMLEGTMYPKQLVKLAKQNAMPALGLADRNNLFGCMEFADYALPEGVQPVTGVLLGVRRPSPKTETMPRAVTDWLPLYAQTDAGYAALAKLVSRAHLESEPNETPALPLEAVAAEDVLALTGGADGALWRLLAEGQRPAAEAYLDRLATAFPGRLYIELQRPAPAEIEEALLDLAYARNLPVVAANPVSFADANQLEAADALVCIGESRVVDEADRPRASPDGWFKPAQAMAELFADLPEAIENTLAIARRCAACAPERKPILPRFAPDEAELLRQTAEAGLARRLKPGVDAAPYLERLDYEIRVIIQMGFPGYFLIVADFIGWAKRQGIPVGPGRGSGAGSLVAWALGITDLDPLRFGLLFERFLNPERVSMPDFDIDFCEERRDEVIRYVQEKYGQGQVAQIITFGKLKARAAIKDVGRVLQIPYGETDRISKLVPNNPANPVTLAQAIEMEPKLAEARDRDPRIGRLIGISLQLEGACRHSSTHAAGVVIGDRPLDELIPMTRDPASTMAVTQFDMKWVERAGLVKFDFLGLKTLSVLNMAVELLKQRGVVLDLLDLPFDDPKTFALLSRGDTVGVFQLEGEGMRRTLAGLKPDKFEDIIALVALYRPGPMDNIPSYNNRKHGVEQPDYLHPLLEPVLAETYGVIIYQEQVMQIAQILAGYSLGEADLLRRAMGKKKKEEMDQQKARFIQGAVAKGVEEARAAYIFELVEKFAGYGFNKSHAAAYALVAYQTAYLKANHPVEFYAASMTYDRANTDKLALFVEDARRLGVGLLGPHVNHSQPRFSVEAGQVRYALAALKGVGEKAMEELVETRRTLGGFHSLSHLAGEIDPKMLNRRQLECLAAAGALDGLTEHRAIAHAAAERVLAHAAAEAERRVSRQTSLFGEALGGDFPALPMPQAEPWTPAQALQAEQAVFGFFFSGHPLDQFAHVLKRQRAITWAQAAALEKPSGLKGGCVTAGIAEETFVRRFQDGEPYTMLVLSDQSGTYRVRCFDREVIEAANRYAQEGAAVLAQLDLRWGQDDDTPRATARGLAPLADLAERTAAELTVVAATQDALSGVAKQLERSKGGRGQVRLSLMLGGGREAEIKLPGAYKVDNGLRAAIASLPGVMLAEMAGG